MNNNDTSREILSLKISPYSPNFGAVISGIDIASGVNDLQFKILHEAFLKYQVLFFQKQNEIPPKIQIDFAKRFGKLHIHPAAPKMEGYSEIFEIHVDKNSKIANGEFWHSDVSCDQTPPLGTILQLHVVPECGGDTLFCNMYLAYDYLSEKFKMLLKGLYAIHKSEHVYRGRYNDRGVSDQDIECPSAIHPILRKHPETGRIAIYVNRTFTDKIEGMKKQESDTILNFLYNHCEQINFQIRYRWSKNDLVFWDNRCTMHRALWDYWPQERKGRRVTIAGNRPA